MNPTNPFSGQQPSGFPTSSSSSIGTFQTKPPFRFGQPSLFGQNNTLSGKSSGFSQVSSFPASSGQSHSSAQTLGFSQTSSVGLFSGLEHTPAFVAASGPSSSCVSGNPGFSFKSPNLGAFPSTSAFGPETGEVASSGFGKTEFSFKPLESSVFRPILGAESEPEKTQSQITSGFFTFSHPVSGGPGGLAQFSFSQVTSSSATNSNFTFSKSGNNNSPSAFTPTLSNQNVEEEKRGPRSLFGSSSSSFTSFPVSSSGSLGEPFPKTGVRQGCEEAVSQMEPLPSLMKGLKRKEDQDRSPRRHGHDAAEDLDPLSRDDHPPDKRPVRLNRPRASTLFGRTIQDVFKSNKEVGRLGSKESKKEIGCAESGENDHVAIPGGSQSVLATSRLPGVNKEEETEGRDKKEDSLRGTPGRQSKRSESTDSLRGVSPSEVTAIQCKNIPDYLNDRTTLENHFGKIAKVQRIYTKRSKKLAVVYFFDHASAALARKKGKGLHKDMAIFWHRKKISPNKKPFSLKEKQPGEGGAAPSMEDLPFQHSPLGKTAGLLSKSSPVKKPSLLKAHQFEGDPFDSGSEVSEGLGPCVPSLSALIGTVAETSEEKYRLLDQRDRIMRQARVKRTDLDKARTFVGTCPDMCPEKERYMRETRSQLSVFEVVPGTDQVDHAAAVKEYSRSSADQEEPLPHELRPSAVLSRTMDYLVTQIMDQKEGSLRDWYDFVWNRTRGVRKDITQQHLCDPVTVSLIEKCTRFHIHCAHFMCEEPMSSFDAKINNENMTKCLQSLKEMYQDLRNRGVLCAREAEFQGYNVLLSLNKGDILREVQQFHPAVRNSSEVKFAVQAFAALSSNNFVRFFKLVQSASYLNACLLHCYFSQIRKDALRALNVAYTVSTQRSTVFPLDSVVRMLLFRDSEEATDFLNCHGLTVSDGCVELNRSSFLEPEGLSKARKSVFITRKLMVSVGEIVNGGPLPPIPRHTPVCSFNSQNKYVGDSLAAELPVGTQKPGMDAVGGGGGEECGAEADAPPPALPPQPLPTPAPAPLPHLPALAPGAAPSLFQAPVQPEILPAKPGPGYSDADLAQVVDELIQEVLQMDCEEVGAAGAAFAATALGVASAAMEELLTAATTGILRHIATEEVTKERERKEEERRRAEEERLKQERELLLTELGQGLAAELTELVVTECVRETCSQELKSAVETDQRVRMARCCEDVCASLVGLFLGEEIFQTAKETLQELQCFCKYLQRWREAVAARKKLRRQMRAFPAAPCCVDVNDRLKALAPSAECPIAAENLAKGLLDLGHAGKVGISCTRLRWLRNKVERQMKVQHFHQRLLSDAAWAPLDLPSLVAKHLPGRRERVFWKLVLMLPDGEEQPPGSPGRVLANWLKVKFMGGDGSVDDTDPDAGGIQTLTLSNTLSSRGDRTISVSVCIKVARGALSDCVLDAAETQKELLGASGLMLLLPPKVKSEDMAEEDVYWLSALLQIKQLLQAKPFQPALPLVVLVPSPGGAAVEKEGEDGLMLQDLVSAKLISDYSIIEIPDSINLQGTTKVLQAVQWLVSHCPCALDLCCQTLVQYVEDGVSREFSGRFFHDRRERRQGGLASQEPSVVIELFNSVLHFLASVASSEQLCDLSWPVPEFAEAGGSQLLPHLHWNTPEHLAWLKQAVLGFQLPQMDLPPPGAPWLPVCSMVVQYASQIPSSRHTQPVLQSQVESLLRSTYRRWKSKSPSPGPGPGPSVAEIPWDDIVALCINHRLRDWTPPRLPVTSEALSEDGQICVYFFKDDLKKYDIPLSWEQARMQTQKELQLSHGRFGIRPLHPSANKLSTPSLHMPRQAKRNVERGREGRLPSAEELTQGASAQELLAQCLSSGLLLEKEESKRFEDQLQQCLSEDSGAFTGSVSLPLYLPQTLVSLPQTAEPVMRASTTTSPQNKRTGEQLQLSEVTGTSLTERLKHLEGLIRSSREEEVASELHLSALLDMVDI
ncbi:germinal-center associated nuclear protein [Camelus ferus]|uniref:Germinal-center associated nuclear protein n=1 Tax=Camelus ferus TaxID=419612 RepID=A0A8B8TJC8_CAMFR|nr:germinal-center associated nuclear protein [Camelus ferus]XP_032342295.1 germinal-center associated nuclear protein [Camelus ferus]XP_032342347.1 germinal-center associated nuclear protein [Camelus ferus]XP_032342412.1 germinal-center associated nuclear protein [Camelus ferus]XP_032342479.1 germinal-center associated nuclear protein [Camelus ferus]